MSAGKAQRFRPGLAALPIASKDFQGRPGCDAPHKIVEFVLPAGTPLTLQFRAGSQDTLKVSVSRSPAQ